MGHVHWIGSPNYSPTRYEIEAVVIHIIDDRMDGDISGTDHWFSTPASGVSAHYAISAAGEIHQYVAETNSAFHAGVIYSPTWRLLKRSKAGRIISPNLYTIGVEHEGKSKSPWPPAMFGASVKLVSEICGRHRIPVDRDHIIGHREINGRKSCPGEWIDLERYVQAVAALTQVPRA